MASAPLKARAALGERMREAKISSGFAETCRPSLPAKKEIGFGCPRYAATCSSSDAGFHGECNVSIPA